VHIDPLRLMRLGELIKQGSFKKAADGLHITQPALSQSIAQMEGEIGVRLIDRTPHGVVPTAYGQALMDHARKIDWQLSEAAKKMAELKFGHQGTLAIGGTSGGAISIIALAVCRLMEMVPGIKTHITEELWNTALLSQLDDRSLDVAICHQPDDAELEGKLAVPLFPARRFLCVRANHPEAGNLTLANVVKYPFACPSSEMGIHQDVKSIFDALQVPFPAHPVTVSKSLSAAKEIVLSSDAFALFSDMSVLHERKAGLIKLAQIDGISTAYWYYVVFRKEQVVSDLLGNVLTALGDVCRGLGIELHPDISHLRKGRPLSR
jgi:DNA-binding transcriptional LysR family regulator